MLESFRHFEVVERKLKEMMIQRAWESIGKMVIVMVMMIQRAWELKSDAQRLGAEQEHEFSLVGDQECSSLEALR